MRLFVALLLLLAVGGEAQAICSESWATSDARQLWCEDWEAITYYDGSPGNVGGGSPLYGPWYDSTGGAHSGKRGHNSLWNKRYGNGSTGMWADGEPGGTPSADVRLGKACDTGAVGGSDGGSCVGMKEWCSAEQGALVDGGAADCWQGNSLGPLIDILREDDYDDEVAGLTLPKYPDGTRGLPGVQGFAFRLKEGSGSILGKSNAGVGFAQPHTVSFAYLVALSSNFTTSGSTVLSNPYKWDQCGEDSHFPLMWSTSCDTERRPFCPIIQAETGTCGTLIASATDEYGGTISCPSGTGGNGFALFVPHSSRFTRSTHWSDMNEWMCVRGKITGTSTTSARMQVWRDNGDGEVEVLDVSGINWSGAAEAVTGWVPNGYSNYLETNSLAAAVFRYEDNIYLRGGTSGQCAGGACDPPTCEQLGFGDTGAPANPTYCCRALVDPDRWPRLAAALDLLIPGRAACACGGA